MPLYRTGQFPSQMPAPVQKSALVRAKLKFFRGGRRYRVAIIALLMVAVFLLGAVRRVLR
jgi:hypothetical protein